MRRCRIVPWAAPTAGYLGWRAAISTLYFSISAVARADPKSFELSGFHGKSAAEGIHVQVATGETFEVTTESDDAQPHPC